MASSLEIPAWINRRTVEDAYRQGVIARERSDRAFARVGLRAARDRSGRLLVALEGMAETLRRMSDEQAENRIRLCGQRIDATEYALVREAYTSVDRGDPIEHLAWIYGMGAALAGYQ